MLRRYKGFQAEFPSGEVDKAAFVNVYREQNPEFGDNSRDFAEYVFDAFDENQDGIMGFDEFVQALSVTKRGRPDEKLKCTLSDVVAR